MSLRFAAMPAPASWHGYYDEKDCRHADYKDNAAKCRTHTWHGYYMDELTVPDLGYVDGTELKVPIIRQVSPGSLQTPCCFCTPHGTELQLCPGGKHHPCAHSIQKLVPRLSKQHTAMKFNFGSPYTLTARRTHTDPGDMPTWQRISDG
jgi:hypothetical protein